MDACRQLPRSRKSCRQPFPAHGRTPTPESKVQIPGDPLADSKEVCAHPSILASPEIRPWRQAHDPGGPLGRPMRTKSPRGQRRPKDGTTTLNDRPPGLIHPCYRHRHRPPATPPYPGPRIAPASRRCPDATARPPTRGLGGKALRNGQNQGEKYTVGIVDPSNLPIY